MIAIHRANMRPNTAVDNDRSVCIARALRSVIVTLNRWELRVSMPVLLLTSPEIVHHYPFMTFVQFLRDLSSRLIYIFYIYQLTYKIYFYTLNYGIVYFF